MMVFCLFCFKCARQVRRWSEDSGGQVLFGVRWRRSTEEEFQRRLKRHFFFFRLLGCTCDGCRAWLEEGVSEKGSTWSHMRMSTARWVTREEWLWTIRRPLNKNDRNGSQCLKADQRPRERCTVTEAAKMLIEEEENPEYWMARPEEIIPSCLFTW